MNSARQRSLGGFSPSGKWGARAQRWLLAADHDRAFAALKRAVAVELNEVVVSRTSVCGC